MNKQSIRDKIDALFTDAQEGKFEDLRSFVNTIRANQTEADTRLRRAAVAFVSAWAVLFAIETGLVEEGQVASFKIAKIKQLMLAGPPLLGLLSYSLLSSSAASQYLLTIMSRCYKNLLPKAHELGLEYLLPSPNVVGVERYFKRSIMVPWLNTISSIWTRFLEILLVIGPIVGISHVSYMLWKSGLFTWILVIISILVGILFWIRGIFLIRSARELEE